MNRDVFLSLLALDAYNRGYGQGVFLNPSDSANGQEERNRFIGTARVTNQSDVEAGTPGVDAGFYAIAYDWNGETVISYRGTNFPNDPLNPTDAEIEAVTADFLGGWSLFTGLEFPVQIDFARDFLIAATGTGFSGVDTISGSSGITLTGHSLGGALAGYVGARGHLNTVAFDPIPFGSATNAQVANEAFANTLADLGLIDATLAEYLAFFVNIDSVIPTTFLTAATDAPEPVGFLDFFTTFDSNLALLSPNFSVVKGYSLEGEIAAAISNIQLVSPVLATSLAPIISVVSPELAGALVVLATDQFFEGLSDSFSGDRDGIIQVDNREVGGLTDTISLHSISLLSILLYGQEQWSGEGGRDGSPWEASIKYIIPGTSDNDIATGLGLSSGPNGTGGSTPGSQLSAMIAYSAINEGTRVFGDTGIRALFSDADRLGAFIGRYENVLSADTLELIGASVAEFTGLLASRKILSDDSPHATKGILLENAAASVFDGQALFIDVSEQTWSQYTGNVFTEPHVSTRGPELIDRLIDAHLAKIVDNPQERATLLEKASSWRSDVELAVITSGTTRAGAFSNEDDGLSEPRTASQLIIIDSNSGRDTNSASGNTDFNDDAPPVFVISGDGDNILFGSNGIDAFFTGSGADFLVGGDSGDFFAPGTGNATIYGDNVDRTGDGASDVVYFSNLGGTQRITYSSDNLDVIGAGSRATLYDVEFVGFQGGDLFLAVQGNIKEGTSLNIEANAGGAQIASGTKARAGLEILISDGFGSITDTDTTGFIALSGFNTTIFGSDFDDTIFDGSDEEKIIFGGAGNDTISIAETLPASILIGGDGTDRFAGGHGNDVIIDQQASATSISVLLRPDIIEPDPYFRSLVGAINAGYGDDDIVIDIAGIPAYTFIDNGFNNFFPALPPGSDNSLNYDLDPGEGNDRTQIDFHGLVNYTYQRGDGGDIVSLNTSGTFGQSDIYAIFPESTIQQTTLSFDFSEYSRSEVTIKFGERSSQLVLRDLPNRDLPDVFATFGDLLIEFSDGGSIFVENLIGLTSSNFHTSYLGNEPEDDEVVFLSASFTFADDLFGPINYAILERSPLSAPPPPPSPIPPQMSGADEGVEDSGGGVGPSTAPALLNGGSIASNSEAATSAAGLNLSAGEAGVTANNAGGTDEPLEVRLKRGQFAYSGSTGVDRLLIEWTLDSLVVSLSDETLTVSDRWGVLGTTTLTGFEEVYVFETDETYTIQGFVDVLAARQFAPSFDGSDSDDAITGTAIRDRIFGLEGNDTIDGLAGDDIINAGDGDDLLTGGDGDDVLLGEAGNDTLHASAGDDRLDGGLGGDNLVGGSGDDTYLVESLSDVVVELEGEGIDRVISSVDHTLTSHVEELSLVDQALEGVGNDLDNTIIGNDANNVLSGLGGDDLLLGGIGSDVLSGGDGNDLLRGQSGDDFLLGGSGNDTLIGGEGFDEIDGGNGFDTAVFAGFSDDYEIILNLDGTIEVFDLSGDEGFDILTNVEALRFTADRVTILASEIPASGTEGDDNITGSSRGDRILGLGGNDRLVGLEGNDYLDGGSGEDVLIGGSGDDRYIVDNPNDLVVELADEGYDFVEASFSFTLGENVEGLALGSDTSTDGTGNALDNDIRGDDQNNVLRGLGGDDYLAGSGGDDLLLGGDGDDTLIGGEGTDDIDGGQGFDTSEYRGDISNYEITRRADGRVLVIDLVGNNGTDTLLNVERLRLSNFPAVGDVVVNVSDLPISSVNSAPVVVNQALGQSVAEDQEFSIAIDVANFTDADGDLLALSVSLSDGTPLPAWLTFDGTRLVGLPPQDFNGVLDLEVTASDGALTATAPFQLTIDPVNDTPVLLQPLADQAATGGGQVAFTIPATAFTDPDGDTLSYTAELSDGSVLPQWLAFDAETRTFAGTAPNASAIFSIRVEASDGTASVEDVFLLTVGLNLTGTSAAETLTGGEGNDTITGLGENDTLIGSGGDDVFRVTGTAHGFDSIDGGTGTDTIVATSNGTIIGLTAINGIEQISGASFSNVAIVGSSNADILNFSAVTLSAIARIDGGAGNDTITGSAGADTIRGSGGNDTIDAGAGDDTIQFGGNAGGFDAVDGGAGTDMITVLGNGTIIGLSSLTNVEAIDAGSFTNVTISGTANDDTLDFSGVTLTSIVRIDGGAGDDTITGSAGADTIRGSGGNDTIDAGAGDDTIQFGGNAGGFDAVDGGAGTDTITVLGNGTIIGLSSLTNVEAIDAGSFTNVTISGTANDDTLDFSGVTLTSIVRIDGGAGNDTITGSAGADTIRGAGGNDILIGGVGALDTAVFAGLQASYSIVTNSGVVTVVDNQATSDGDDGTDTISGIERLEFKGGVQVGITSPIILDLDGNGVETLSAAESDARFDLDGDGLADDTSWIGAGDAFLYLDRDANGTVSGVEEISFVDDVPNAATDLAGLRAFDSNADGLLDARDERFADFGVWRDADGDGAVDEGETPNLATVGIRSINLAGTAVDAVTEFGEVAIANTGSFTLTTGATRTFADAALTYFSAATNLPSLGVTHYDFGRKASKYRISAAGGALTVAPKNAPSGRDPLAGQLGANTILTFRGRDYGMFAPVVLDLDGDGVELVSRKKSRASFDYGGDGASDDTGWIGRDDGFLVIDRNNDGLITEASELSLASEDEDARSGLQGLARLDSNGDGVVDSEDARFGELRVWQDRNGNGRTDAGELRSLEEAGLVAIRLNAVTPSQARVKLDRNVIAATTTFVRANGTTSTAADVSLAYRPVEGNAALATSLASSFDRFGPDLFLAPFRETGFEREALLPAIDELVGLLGNASSQRISELFDRYAAESAIEPARSQPALTVPAIAERATELGQRGFDPLIANLRTYETFQQQFMPEVTIKLQASDPLPNAQLSEAYEPEPVLDQSVSSIAASESLSAADSNVVEVNQDGSPVDEVAAQPASPQLGSRPLLDPAQYAIWGGPAWIAGLPTAPGQSVEVVTPTANVVRPRLDLAAVLAQPNGDATASDAEVARKLAMIRQDMSSFGIAGAGELERMGQFEPQSSYLYA